MSEWYPQYMAQARIQAERGSVMHTVGEVHSAWNHERDLPPDAEEQARSLFRLANRKRRNGPTPNVTIDSEYVLGILRWTHAQQDPNSPWGHLRDTAVP